MGGGNFFRAGLVKGLVLALGMFVGSQSALAEPCGFRAHLNYSPQRGGFQFNTYSQEGGNSLLKWTGKAFDVGGRFVENRWTPVKKGEAARLVTFSGQLWLTANAQHRDGGVPILVAKIIKNGYGCTKTATGTSCSSDVVAGIGMPSTINGTVVIPFAGTDLASPGDTYQLFFWTTNPDTVVDGNPGHTWFSGVCN